MNMLIDELQSLAADPRSWVVVGVLAVISLGSMIMTMRCHYITDASKIADETVEKAKAQVFKPGLQFALMMLLGIGLTIAGLFMIASGIKPTLALAALVCGVFLTQTEPIRLQIRNARNLIAANRDSGAEAVSASQERLRSGYSSLALTNVFLCVAITAGLLAF